MKNLFSQNLKATIGGYIIAMYNASIGIDWDLLDYHSINTYLKIFGVVFMPILLGHATEVKEKEV